MEVVAPAGAAAAAVPTELGVLLDSLPFSKLEREEISKLLLADSNKNLTDSAFHSLPLVLNKQAELLVHSSKCLIRSTTRDSSCPIFPLHCAKFQNLFFHMQACAKQDCVKCGQLKAHIMLLKKQEQSITEPPTRFNDLLLPYQILENAQLVKRLKLAKTAPGVDAEQVSKLLLGKEQYGYLLQHELLRLCQGNKQKFNDLLAVCLEQLTAKQTRAQPRPAAPPPPPPQSTVAAAPAAAQQQRPAAAVTMQRPAAPAATKPPRFPSTHSSTKQTAPAAVAAAAPTSATPPAPPVKRPSSSSSKKKDDKRAALQAQQDRRNFLPANPERRNTPFPLLTQEHLDFSFINSLHHKDIVAHVGSLARYQHRKEGTGQTNASSRNFDPTKNFRLAANQLLRILMELPFAHVFRHPVDPVALGLDSYFDIVKHPMDLGTIKQRLESKTSGGYTKLAEFVSDVRLMFDNAILFNTLEQDVGKIAAEYGALFERQYYSLCADEEQKFTDMRYASGVAACNLCGHCEDFLFEPPVFICDVCDNRIKRDSLMYVNTSADHRVCRACFKDQPGSFLRFAVEGSEEKFSKSLFKEQKNNQIVKEEWVICFYCRRKSHAICGMAKTPAMANKREFICPFCMLRYLEAKTFQQTDFNAFPVHINLDAPTPPPKRTAADLLETPLAAFIQQKLEQRVAKELAANTRPPGKLTVRVVLNKKEDLFTREGMLELYGNETTYGYPKSFPTRQKCILLFEEIDGLDVLLFVMYVQYFGSDAPHPNKRSMYISYLDSVNFFSVRELRTSVYQEILISLLEFEKQSGYVRCFIWSCPPANGDDYIFHVHPKTQRIPDAQKLRNWYFDLLEQARQRNIVMGLNTLLDEYICRVPDVRFVPYFDGDWVNVYGEFFIRNLKKKDINPLRRQSASEASKNTGTLLKLSEQEVSMQKLANKQQRKQQGGDVAFASQRKQQQQQQLENGLEVCAPIRPLLSVPVQDVLTAKILVENDKMRKDFIVVKMCQECSECSKQMDEPGVLHWISPTYDAKRDPHDYRFRTYASPYCLCHACYVRVYEEEYGAKPKFEIPAPQHEDERPRRGSNELDVEFKFPAVAAAATTTTTTATPQRGAATSSPTPPGIVTRRKRNHGETTDSLFESTKHGAANSGIQVLRLGQTAKPPNAYTTGQYLIDLKSMKLVRANVADTAVERDMPVESPVFDKRRGFVMKCQDRKWQFDELRRAKHSTQSLLDLLHNSEEETDQFVQICSNCQVELNQEYYSCNTGGCEDFDLCLKCHSTVKHAHPLVLIRAMELKSALAMMDHMKNCTASGCEYCIKMKRLFAHFEKCSLREAGGCGGCKRFMYLLSSHVKQCRDAQCTLPHCARLKHQNRRRQEGDNDRRVMSLGRDAAAAAAATPAAAGAAADDGGT